MNHNSLLLRRRVIGYTQPMVNAANPPGERTRPLRREAKTEATRRRLFEAALDVVGEFGYAGTSIAKITERAQVAQGTFYNYFTSQQDLFDQLLPYLGDRLLDEIREQLKDCRDSFRREEIGFRAYFDFLARNPAFERIYTESEVFTPQGFQDHVRNIVRGYRRSFRRSMKAGQLPHYSERELEAVTYILLGARTFLSKRYMTDRFDGAPSTRLPEWVVATYMKFFRYGLAGPRRGVSSRGGPGPMGREPDGGPEIVERGAGRAVLLLDDAAVLGVSAFAAATELARLAAAHAVRSLRGVDPGAPQGVSLQLLMPLAAGPLLATAQCGSGGATMAVHVRLEQAGRSVAEALITFAGRG